MAIQVNTREMTEVLDNIGEDIILAIGGMIELRLGAFIFGDEEGPGPNHSQEVTDLVEVALQKEGIPEQLTAILRKVIPDAIRDYEHTEYLED